MKTTKNLRSLALCGGLSLLCSLQVMGQQNPSSQANPEATKTDATETGRPDIPGRPQIIPPDPPSGKAKLPEAPPRPSHSGHPAPSESVRDLVQDFQKARQEYLSIQEQLRRQLKEATQEERAALREELKENLANWLAEQRSRVQELRDQAKEIKDKVPSISDVVDSAREEGRRR